VGSQNCWVGIVAMAKSKREAACHEAGHALCAVLLGFGCREVIIEFNNGGWLGDVWVNLPAWCFQQRNDGEYWTPPSATCRPDFLQTFEAWLVYLAGGAIAEYQVMGTQLPKSPEAHEDWNRIHDAVDQITRNEDESRALVDRVIWRATELLMKHRRALDALASAIAKRKHLSGEEVKAIIAQATGVG